MRKSLICSSLLVVLVGCPFVDPDPDETGVADLVPFQSAQEVLDYIADQVNSSQQRNGGVGLFDGIGFGPAPSPPAEPATGGEAADQGQDDVSGTNLQEVGVDESDFVKNDGQYIYILRSENLSIVKATPPDQMQQVASIPIEGYGDALYLSGNRVVALTQRSYYYGGGPVPMPEGPPVRTTAAQADGSAPQDDGPRSLITIIDVTDPANPDVAVELALDGNLNTSRLIDGKLHVVLNHWPTLPVPLDPPEIRQAPIEDVLPTYSQTTDGTVVSQGSLVEPTDMYHPVDPNGYSMTVVATIDITSDDPDVLSTAVMADAGTVYASTQALYVTDTDYTWFGDFRDTTDIYKFDLTGDEPAYVAAGTVKGRFLNQYSLGEYEDHLRVATTSTEGGGGAVPLFDSFAPPVSKNNVYVLAQQGEDLNVVGSAEGLAPGEQIYAARFVGPRGFLVTFVQIDPLFTLDLSDPTNPQVLGELKVDGVSDYIHVLDENHLLTVGRGAIPQGEWALFQGMQLSIFDITDFADPTLQTRVELGDRGTRSEVIDNPKAVTFLPSQNLMALPVDLHEKLGQEPWDYGVLTFSGIYVYRVTAADGFEELGRISTQPPRPYASYYGPRSRGVFIGDSVYAVTEGDISAAPISDVNSAPWSLQLPQ